MEIFELKEKLELAIGERLQEFKDRASRYEDLATQLEIEHDWMIRIATELKSVEYIIQANGNSPYVDMINQLLQDNKKVSDGSKEEKEVPLCGNKKRK